MIPKTIHYCWFGRNPLSEKALKCINSWKKFMPDYEIKEWNEDSFNVNIIKYTAEAYKLKKYAFVSDYARFWILYHYGGIYFDVDVELVRPIDDIIARGAFMGCEKTQTEENVLNPNSGVGMGAPSHHPFYKKVLSIYQNKHFVYWNGKISESVVYIISRLFENKKQIQCENNIILSEDIYIYPHEYFCPLNYITKKLTITPNTKSIHHYHASWTYENHNLLTKVKFRLTNIYVRVYISLKSLFFKK